MDWLRKSLRAEEELGKEKEEEKHEGGEEGEKEREKEGGNKGGGVKEDLSEITRHIWGGVASFLAPPPPPPPVSQRVLKQEEEVSIEEVKTGGSSKPEETHESLSTLTDLGEVNLGSQQEEGEEKEGYLGEVKLTGGRGDQILTGVRSDLAELKGSVATGLSRFIKAVRVEIEGEEEEERRKGEKDKKEDRQIRQNQAGDSKTGAFNSALNPLYGSILPQQEDDDGGEEAGMKRGGSIDDLISGGLEGVSKLASSLFPRAPPPTLSDSEAKVEPRVVGVTEEVLMWAKNISTHPETWLDFPHPLDDPDGDDFVLSSAQKEHIEAVESATHRLAALRIELCPDYMSEGRFWKIYFVLLYSRLNKQDAHLLSTPQVLVARNHLLHELQKEDSYAHRNESAEINTTSSASLSSETIEKTKLISMQSAAGSVSTNDFKCPPREERSPPVNMREEKTEEEVQNKSVLLNTVNIKEEKKEEEEEVDEWPDEEPSSTTLHCTRVGSNEEDVSFSDLEEEEEEEGSATISVNSKHLQSFSPKRAPQGLNEVEKEPLLPSTSSTSASASASTMNEVKEEPLLPSKSSTSASASASTNTSTSSSSTKNKADSGEPSDWLTIDEEYLASANLY